MSLLLHNTTLETFEDCAAPVLNPSTSGFDTLTRRGVAMAPVTKWPPGIDFLDAHPDFPTMFAHTSRPATVHHCNGLVEWEVTYKGEIEAKGAVRTGVRSFIENIKGLSATPASASAVAEHDIREPHISCTFVEVVFLEPDMTIAGSLQTPPDAPTPPAFYWGSIGNPIYNWPAPGWSLENRIILEELAGTAWAVQDEYVHYYEMKPGD